MDEQWILVTSGQQLVDMLGLSHVGQAPLELVLLAPESSQYLRVDTASEPGDSSFKVAIRGTRVFFNVTACKELGGDIVIALAAYCATGSGAGAALASAGLLRKLRKNFKRVTSDELLAVRAIMSACLGNPFQEPTGVAEVRVAFTGDTEALDDLLSALEVKEVIRSLRGDRVQLVF